MRTAVRLGLVGLVLFGALAGAMAGIGAVH
jgi:hypothetical protein